MSNIREKVLSEVKAERQRQVEMHPVYLDLANSANDWVAYITAYAGFASDRCFATQDLDFRSNMIKVAALAIAAVEAHDRGYMNE